MNTYGEKFKDSAKWTMDGTLVRQTSYTEQASHKITFSAVAQTIEVCTDYAGKAVFPNVNVQQGFTLGWYHKGEPVNSDTVFTENTTVSAKVTPSDKAKIDYILNGGENSPLNPDELGEGETAQLSAPTKEGAQFTGWYVDSQLKSEPITSVSFSDGSKTLYAGWKSNTCTVDFTDINGTVLSSQTVEYGKSADPPKAPTIKGKRFTGWDKDFSKVTAHMTVQAVYTDRKLIKDCEISGFKTHMTFTGYELAQSGITLSYGDTTLTNNKDYTIDYADNIAAGKGKMIITGIGGYSGTIAKAFDILPKSAQLTSVYYVDALSYTGKPIRPDVMVTDGGKFLLPEHDYTVSYSSNTKIGVGKIIISFMGNYQGTITKTFTICPAKQEIQSLQTRYKGFFIDFAQKGSATGYELQYSTRSDFAGAKTLIISSNKTDKKTVSNLTAGKKYYVRVRSYTIVSGKRYNGAWSDTKSVTTAKYDIAKAKVAGIKNKSFTGRNITQSITVTYSGKTLKNGTDYIVKYSCNKNIGTAKVAVTGKGSYGGVITKSFVITPAKQTIQKLMPVKKGFYIDYAQKGSATGYVISYAENISFSDAKTVKVTSNKTDKKTVTNLKSQKTYFVRVRSYTATGNKTYFGQWSDIAKVYTK